MPSFRKRILTFLESGKGSKWMSDTFLWQAVDITSLMSFTTSLEDSSIESSSTSSSSSRSASMYASKIGIDSSRCLQLWPTALLLYHRLCGWPLHPMGSLVDGTGALAHSWVFPIWDRGFSQYIFWYNHHCFAVDQTKGDNHKRLGKEGRKGSG